MAWTDMGRSRVAVFSAAGRKLIERIGNEPNFQRVHLAPAGMSKDFILSGDDGDDKVRLGF